MTYMDQTFCNDTECLRFTCFRHPDKLRSNYQNLPVAMCSFTECTLRKHKEVWPDHERIDAIGLNGNTDETVKEHYNYDVCVKHDED